MTHLNLTDSAIVVKASSGFYTVHDADGREQVCQMIGRLKQQRLDTDLIAVGDHVRVEMRDDTPQIVDVLPRRSKLSRRAPDPHTGRKSSTREQVIVANPDQVAFVFACHDPKPHVRMLDRYLVIAETQRLPAIIVANKIDLIGIDAARQLFDVYERIGYSVYYTSAAHNEGIDVLHEQLRARISVLSGPSGVGKSSLLNALQSGLGLAARTISAATRKGRHTTVTVQLLPFAGGYIADTPGLRALGLWDVNVHQIAWGFREFRPFIPQCKYNDCEHISEPDCAVIEAVGNDAITPERYDSYLRMLEE